MAQDRLNIRTASESAFIGQDISADASDLVLKIPSIPPEWQFLIGIIPIQVVAERVAYLGNQDCDAFCICPYIVEEKGDLIRSNGQFQEVARAE
ncbi:MAG TPA: hypothetical protein VFA74_18530 [Terriglobales bacterium]|nr:hypothetical protein [Terriglobales bacterium]